MKIRKADIIADLLFLMGIAVCITLVACGYAGAEMPETTVCEPTTLATTAETVEPTQIPTVTETTPETTAEATTQATEETKQPIETEPPYTAEDLEYLALVIYQEAGADYVSDETRLMVGTVVMNRVSDPRFPDTIYDVLMQKGQYGRLYWTGMKWADRASQAVEAHAVERAYRCAKKILSGYRSFGSDVIWQAEFIQGSEIVAYQDGLYFCR